MDQKYGKDGTERPPGAKKADTQSPPCMIALTDAPDNRCEKGHADEGSDEFSAIAEFTVKNFLNWTGKIRNADKILKTFDMKEGEISNGHFVKNLVALKSDSKPFSQTASSLKCIVCYRSSGDAWLELFHHVSRLDSSRYRGNFATK